MSAEPTEPKNQFKPMTLALAGVGALSALAALLPESQRPWNVALVGSVGLFAAARLSLRQAAVVLALTVGIKDASIYIAFDWPPEPFSWLAYGAYVLFGRLWLRNTESPLLIGSAAISGSFLFFLISNFGSWLAQAQPYGYSPAGLLNCYEAAIPFYRGTLISDLFGTATLFSLHAVLSRAYFPAERVAYVPATQMVDESGS